MSETSTITDPTDGSDVSLVDAPDGTPAPDLALRIVQSGGQDQMQILPMGQCTVGSSPRCQIQLQSEEVSPLHCLILRGPRETSVTRWAPGVLLNEQQFHNAVVVAGDCLKFGDLELHFEAVPTEQARGEQDSLDEDMPQELDQQPTEAEQQQADSHLAAPAVAPDATPSATEIPAGRVSSTSHIARTRCRKLVQAMRGLRTEVTAYEKQVTDLQDESQAARSERDRLAADLDNFQLEAAERNLQAAEEANQLASELTEAYEKTEKLGVQVSEYLAENERLRAELAAATELREQLEAAAAADQQRKLELEQTLAEHEQHLETVQGELKELCAAKEEALSELATVKTECEALQETMAAYQQREQEWEQTNQQREELVGKMITSRDELRRTVEQSQAQTTAVQAEFDEAVARLDQLEAEILETAEKHHTTSSASSESFESSESSESSDEPRAPLCEEQTPQQEQQTAGDDYFAAPARDPQQEEEFQPPSFIEQYSELVETEEPSPTVESAAEDSPVVSPAPDGDLDDDSEEALQDYMAHMMERMCGSTWNPESTPAAPAAVESQSDASDTRGNQFIHPTVADHAAAEPRTDPTVAEPVTNLAAPEPRAAEEPQVVLPSSPRRPELSTDLAAMRDLANSSARNAIAKHHQKDDMNKAVASFVGCLVCMTLGLYLIFALAPEPSLANHAELLSGAGCLAVGFGVVAGVIGIWKMVVYFMQAILSGSEEEEEEDYPPGADENNLSSEMPAVAAYSDEYHDEPTATTEATQP